MINRGNCDGKVRFCPERMVPKQSIYGLSFSFGRERLQTPADRPRLQNQLNSTCAEAFPPEKVRISLKESQRGVCRTDFPQHSRRWPVQERARGCVREVFAWWEHRIDREEQQLYSHLIRCSGSFRPEKPGSPPPPRSPGPPVPLPPDNIPPRTSLNRSEALRIRSAGPPFNQFLFLGLPCIGDLIKLLRHARRLSRTPRPDPQVFRIGKTWGAASSGKAKV